MDGRGFTLVEVLVAMVAAAAVSGTVFLLVDAGLDLHSTGSEHGMASKELAGTTALLRADIARAAAVAHAGPDSAVFDLADGRSVEWVTRGRVDGADLWRSVDDGSGFVEHPKRPVLALSDGAIWNARALFVEEGSGMVRAHLRSSDANTTIEARPWRAP